MEEFDGSLPKDQGSGSNSNDGVMFANKITVDCP